jgi:hypothetical protein
MASEMSENLATGSRAAPSFRALWAVVLLGLTAAPALAGDAPSFVQLAQAKPLPAIQLAQAKPPFDDPDDVLPLAPAKPAAGLQLRASRDILTGGIKARLTVVDCGTPTGVQPNCPNAATPLQNWSVNGMPGGSDLEGWLSTAGPATSVVYSAPNFISWNETIAVSASVPSASGAVMLVANIRLVPDEVAYTDTVRSTFATEGTLRRFTAEVGFDEQGQGSGRARFFGRDSRCTGEDPAGLVKDGSLAFVTGLGPGEGDTYYQIGIVVFTKLVMKCKTPSGGIDAAGVIEQADGLSFITCAGMPSVPGTTSAFTPEGLRAVKVEGDGSRLIGSADCTKPGSNATHRIQWDLRRVREPK